MTKPLVSVIIPTYNCSRDIEKCIESIEKQTYNNIEIIVCDDCSTDNTREILKELEKKYNNIKILYNETNLKAAATRNKCIENSKGVFIAIQDADDYSDISRIESQVSFLMINPDIDYVSSSAIIFDENGKKGERFFSDKVLTDKDFYKGLPLIHGATLFRKSAMIKVNGYRVDKTTVRGQDADMFYRMQIAKLKGATTSDLLYYYNEDDSAFKRRKYKYRIYAYRMRKKYYKQLDLNFFEKLYRFKPLVVGLIPINLHKKYRELKEGKRLSKNFEEVTGDNKIKVAQVIKKMDIGGIETFLMNVCRNIDYDKFQIDFIFFDKKPGLYDPEIIKLGCNIHHVCKKGGVISHMLSLKSIFRQGRYDVVHAHSSFYNGIILLAAKLAKVKLKVSHAHGTGDNKKQTVLRKIYAFFSRLCIRKCANIFCACSKEAGNFLYGKDIKNLNVIENGIDINKFKYDQCKRKELREKLCVNDDKIIIGHVGRFSKEKNHKFILEIFSKLNKINPNTELWLIGEGTLYNSIEEEIRKNNMDSKVKLFGNTSEVELYLSAMDVFIFPSIHEGLGISLIEAQCSGVKCVVSDAIPELAIINSNVIKLCLSGSEDRWISELLDKGKRIEHIDYEKFKYFDIKNSIKKIEEIYENV